MKILSVAKAPIRLCQLPKLASVGGGGGEGEGKWREREGERYLLVVNTFQTGLSLPVYQFAPYKACPLVVPSPGVC